MKLAALAFLTIYGKKYLMRRFGFFFIQNMLIVTVWLMGCFPAIAQDQAADQWIKFFTDLSYPPRYQLRNVMNPWGEQLVCKDELPPGWANRLLLACECYYRQKIRFDAYPGSTGDGSHYLAAIDRSDMSYIPNIEADKWDAYTNKITDDLTERLWLAGDFPIHALSLAGFPIRWAMKAHFEELQAQGKTGDYPKDSDTSRMTFYRQINNLHTYFKEKQWYYRDLLGKERYHDDSYRPRQPFQPGDLVFFGRYGPDSSTGIFDYVRLCAIVITVDDRGLPDELYDMRMPELMRESYKGEIDMVVEVNGEQAVFNRFCDRYPIIAHARITNWLTAPPEAKVEVDMPAPKPDGLDSLPPIPTPVKPEIRVRKQQEEPNAPEPALKTTNRRVSEPKPKPTPSHEPPQEEEPSPVQEEQRPAPAYRPVDEEPPPGQETGTAPNARPNYTSRPAPQYNPYQRPGGQPRQNYRRYQRY